MKANHEALMGYCLAASESYYELSMLSDCCEKEA